jgi:hypothetical protein
VVAPVDAVRVICSYKLKSNHKQKRGIANLGACRRAASPNKISVRKPDAIEKGNQLGDSSLNNEPDTDLKVPVWVAPIVTSSQTVLEGYPATPVPWEKPVSKTGVNKQ